MHHMWPVSGETVMPPHLKAQHLAAILDQARFGHASLADIQRATRYHEDLAEALLDAFAHAPGRRPLSDEVLAQVQQFLCSGEFTRLL